MNRYDPKIFSELRRSTRIPENVKPLNLTFTQFYAFMLQRCLNKGMPEIPRGSSKLQAVFDMLQIDDSNPLSVYMYPNIAYVPDGNVRWSINKYE